MSASKHASMNLEGRRRGGGGEEEGRRRGGGGEEEGRRRGGGGEEEGRRRGGGGEEGRENEGKEERKRGEVVKWCFKAQVWIWRGLAEGGERSRGRGRGRVGQSELI